MHQEIMEAIKRKNDKTKEAMDSAKGTKRRTF